MRIALEENNHHHNLHHDNSVAFYSRDNWSIPTFQVEQSAVGFAPGVWSMQIRQFRQSFRLFSWVEAIWSVYASTQYVSLTNDTDRTLRLVQCFC